MPATEKGTNFNKTEQSLEPVLKKFQSNELDKATKCSNYTEVST
jgi:hypothetical protein